MKLSTLLKASHSYGGPYKLLLLNLRGGQFIGAILALSCYAWIMSTISSHHLPVAAVNKAIVGLGTYISVYILASMPGTWYFFDKRWFEWANMVGDVVAVAGSIAVAVLTRGSTANCSGIFLGDEAAAVGMANMSQACKLQKVVFATGICNSLMFAVTFALWTSLTSRLLDRNAGRDIAEGSRKDAADLEEPSSEVKHEVNC